MPELPEVETLRRTLLPHLAGRRIVRVKVRERRLREPLPEGFEASLEGRQVLALRRRGKFLLADLDDGRVWVVHLGMSGQFCVGPAAPGTLHVHVVIALDDGLELFYRDPRRFGLMRLEAGEPELNLGPDPIVDGIGFDLLWALTRRCSGQRIKTLLMDQRRIAGLGNIYASEALFRAGVRPGRRAGRLTRAEAARVALAVGETLDEALAAGGSSLVDYRDAEGREGGYQNLFRVYDREGLPCLRCASAIRHQTTAGRSTSYCPSCQR